MSHNFLVFQQYEIGVAGLQVLMIPREKWLLMLEIKCSYWCLTCHSNSIGCVANYVLWGRFTIGYVNHLHKLETSQVCCYWRIKNSKHWFESTIGYVTSPTWVRKRHTTCRFSAIWQSSWFKFPVDSKKKHDFSCWESFPPIEAYVSFNKTLDEWRIMYYGLSSQLGLWIHLHVLLLEN